jgi:methylamine---glutamate N-methyltransferase subunit B
VSNDASRQLDWNTIPTPVLAVPEIRDYQRVNAELVQLLASGARRVRLAGVEGQRLLVSGLTGSWDAIVEIEGTAGPELAAGLDAPGLTVICHGDAADGAGSGLRDGRVVILGTTGSAAGYALRGGTLVVTGHAGPRVGLNQSGGAIVILGATGELAGERQAGGILFARADLLSPFAGRAHRGGRLVRWDENTPLALADSNHFHQLIDGLQEWMPVGVPLHVEPR